MSGRARPLYVSGASSSVAHLLLSRLEELAQRAESHPEVSLLPAEKHAVAVYNRLMGAASIMSASSVLIPPDSDAAIPGSGAATPVSVIHSGVNTPAFSRTSFLFPDHRVASGVSSVSSSWMGSASPFSSEEAAPSSAIVSLEQLDQSMIELVSSFSVTPASDVSADDSDHGVEYLDAAQASFAKSDYITGGKQLISALQSKIDFDKFKEQLQEFVNLYKKKTHEEEALDYLAQGLLHMRLQDWKTAKIFLLATLGTFEAKSDLSLAQMGHTYLSTVYRQLGLEDKANSHFSAAMDLVAQILQTSTAAPSPSGSQLGQELIERIKAAENLQDPSSSVVHTKQNPDPTPDSGSSSRPKRSMP